MPGLLRILSVDLNIGEKSELPALPIFLFTYMVTCIDIRYETITTANVEENSTISKALSRLSEVEGKIHELHDKQVSHQEPTPATCL